MYIVQIKLKLQYIFSTEVCVKVSLSMSFAQNVDRLNGTRPPNETIQIIKVNKNNTNNPVAILGRPTCTE